MEKPDYTTPIPWVIVIDAMTHDQAIEIGKLLGSHGVTGRFMAGDYAQNMARYAKWLTEQEGKEVS